MTEANFPPAQQRLMKFIGRRFGRPHGSSAVTKLLGDASTRQYFRYFSEESASYIVAVYPQPFDPDRFAYRQIYELFRGNGIPVPELLELDGPLGIALLEDLGDDSLQKRFRYCSPAEMESLLKRAVDHIIAIQQATCRLTPRVEASRLAFDEEKLSGELDFFRHFYLEQFRRLELPQRDHLQSEFNRLAAELASAERVLCHRDYHVRNLMLKSGEVFLIDFQDARLGPRCYDLVSLLKDSIALEAELVQSLAQEFLKKSRTIMSPKQFWREFHLMAIQRLLKALGTYGYQAVMRENFIYEQYMAGSLERILLSLQEVGEFPYIQLVVEEEVKRFQVG